MIDIIPLSTQSTTPSSLFTNTFLEATDIMATTVETIRGSAIVAETTRVIQEEGISCLTVEHSHD